MQVKIGGIGPSQIEAMVAQLKATAARMEAGAPTGVENGVTETPKLDFASALKSSLEQVSGAQNSAKQMGERFALGDDSVSLSETMIAMQKASISFQATVQVRNKLISAYHDIMNMQI